MRKLDKSESRQRYGELRDLWNEWDPIGVASEDNQDEYQSYAGETMRLLESGASTEEIVKYLSDIIDVRMGLGKEGVLFKKPRAFAQKMQAWYTEKWPETKV